jgi:hypothetical protein
VHERQRKEKMREERQKKEIMSLSLLSNRTVCLDVFADGKLGSPMLQGMLGEERRKSVEEDKYIANIHLSHIEDAV